MKPPIDTTVATARGGTITRRELDDLVARILDSAAQLVRFDEAGIEMQPYNVKRNKELARDIKTIGAETLLMFTEPGGRAIIQTLMGPDTGPGSRLGKRLVRYAEGLMSRSHMAADDIEALRAELADPANVSDELALAARFLDRFDAEAYPASEWLGGLSSRAHACTIEQITGYDWRLPGGPAEHYESMRAGEIEAMIRLVDMTLGHGSNVHGQGIWPYASSIHERLHFPGGSNAMLGHFDTWPAGLVEVIRLPHPGSDWSENTSQAAQLATMLRGGKTMPPSTDSAFRVAVTVEELMLGREQLLDLVARRCVRESKYLTDIQIEHIGPWTEYKHSHRRIAPEGELLVLLNVVADASGLLKAYMDGTLVVPKTQRELDDEAWMQDRQRSS